MEAGVAGLSRSSVRPGIFHDTMAATNGTLTPPSIPEPRHSSPNGVDLKRKWGEDGIAGKESYDTSKNVRIQKDILDILQRQVPLHIVCWVKEV